MAKPVKPAKKKKSGNLLVHVVLLLLLATVGWRLYALQGQVRAAQAERDQYARQVENVQQENETLRSRDFCRWKKRSMARRFRKWTR